MEAYNGNIADFISRFKTEMLADVETATLIKVKNSYIKTLMISINPAVFLPQLRLYFEGHKNFDDDVTKEGEVRSALSVALGMYAEHWNIKKTPKKNDFEKWLDWITSYKPQKHHKVA